ncbi:MAG TPA: hypothetical protein VFX45_05755 [Solirubrobacterales bacterium]|nr:hypothetical protein [Solirubrobacterales bacterium]
MNAPGDAKALRRFYFDRLMRSNWAGVLTLLLVVAVAKGVTVSTPGPALSIGGGVLAFALATGIAYAVAGRRAGRDFFASYARSRDLTLGGKAPLPGATPLLRRGEDRYAVISWSGELGAGVSGSLALFTWESRVNTAKHKSTTYFNYTVGLVEVRECAHLVPELYCQRRFGPRGLDGLEDAVIAKQRVEFESQVLTERYEVFAGPGQDAIWLRRLFSPSFIVWLAESAPEWLRFELVDGWLCCYVKGHMETAAELDSLALATATVARRLREESEETLRQTIGSAP